MKPAIQQFLMQLPAHKKLLAGRLRDIILSVDDQIEETIKWNQLTFVLGKANIAFIYTYKTVDYVNLGFFNATSLQDPDNKFEGTGEKMRHVKVQTLKDISEEQIRDWVKQAITLFHDKNPAK